MGRHFVDWAGRLDELRAMVEAGALCVEIGRHFGCSASTASHALKRYGMRPCQERVAAARTQGLLGVHACPEKTALRVERLRTTLQSQSARRRKSKIMFGVWQDTSRRERQSESVRQQYADNPERRQRLSKSLKAHFAREKAKAEAQAAEAARIAAMTPFERQLWLIDTGRARITDRRAMRRPDPQYSYGVADYAC